MDQPWILYKLVTWFYFYVSHILSKQVMKWWIIYCKYLQNGNFQRHFLLGSCSYLFCRCWSSFVLSARRPEQRPVSGNLREEIDEVHTRAPPSAAAARHKEQSAAGLLLLLLLAAQTSHLLYRQEETWALCAWNIYRDEDSKLNAVIIDKYFVFFLWTQNSNKMRRI